jgi:hypothetical protein
MQGVLLLGTLLYREGNVFAQSCLPNFPSITILWGISVYSYDLYTLYEHAVQKSVSFYPYVTIPLILCVSQKFLDHFFLFVCRTHAAQRIVDSVPCNLKRVVFESSQERSLRVSISTNSIHVRESPINFNSYYVDKVYLFVAFVRFEHQIRPEHVLPSAAAHDSIS